MIIKYDMNLFTMTRWYSQEYVVVSYYNIWKSVNWMKSYVSRRKRIRNMIKWQHGKCNSEKNKSWFFIWMDIENIKTSIDRNTE